MPSLPFDVHAMILQWVYRLSQSRDVDYPTLAASSLVCRSWTSVAQRLLFRRIRAGSDGIADESAFLIRSITQNPRLGSYVRSVVLMQMGNHANGIEERVNLLGLCPNVVAIHFPGYVSHMLMAERFGRMSRIRTINLKPTFLTLGAAPITTVSRFLALWPSIRYLRTIKIFILPSDNPWPLPHGALHSLEVEWTQSGMMEVELDYLGWIAQEPSTLQSLIIDEGWPKYPMPLHVTSKILSLTLSIIPPPDVLEMFIRLEELIIAICPTTALSLPPGLLHLCLHERAPHADAELLRPLVQALSASPNLQIVTATRGSSQEVLSTLEGASLSRHVDFVIFPDAQSFPRPRHVDWI